MTVAPSRQRRVVPEWLDNVAALGWRVLAAVALAAIAIFIAAELMTVTASILVAAIVSATFAPFVLRLRDRGWGRTRAAAAVTVGIVLVLGVTLVLIALAFVPYFPELAAAINTAVARVSAELATISVPPETIEAGQSAADSVGTSISTALSGLAGNLAMAATVGLLALFLTFFFLQDGDKAWGWAFQATTGTARERIATAGHDALERVGGYLRGTAVLAALDAVTDFAFLYLLGVPLAAPLSVLVFFGGFIPYVGGIVTTVILLLVTYATQGATAAIVFFILINLRNVIQSNLVRPVVYGKTVNMHPALVLVALPTGAAVAGIIGLFVAIPVVAMVLAVSGAVVAVLDPGPDHEPPGLVPGWLDRLGQWSWRLLVAILLALVAVGIIVLIPTVAVSVVLAVVFTATLRPLLDVLIRRGRRRSVAALIATGGAYLLIIVIVGVTIVSLVDQAGPLMSTASSGAASIDDGSGGIVGWLEDVVETYGAGVIGAIAGLASALVDLGIVLVLSGLLCFYFLRDGQRYWQHLTARLPRGRGADVEAAGARAMGVLGGYMVGTGAISVFGAVTQFLIMVILGLPLALPLAVLAFFGGFIPYIGSLLTTALAFFVAVAVGSPEDIIIMALYTVVFNIVQGNFVAPLVYSRAVSLHPAVVLMAIPAGSEIAGVLGMFLAVPFLGVIAATWRTVLRAFASRASIVAEEVARRAGTAPGEMTLDTTIQPGPAPDATPS